MVGTGRGGVDRRHKQPAYGQNKIVQERWRRSSSREDRLEGEMVGQRRCGARRGRAKVHKQPTTMNGESTCEIYVGSGEQRACMDSRGGDGGVRRGGCGCERQR
jgi:hypothetical protein